MKEFLEEQRRLIVEKQTQSIAIVNQCAGALAMIDVMLAKLAEEEKQDGPPMG